MNPYGVASLTLAAHNFRCSVTLVTPMGKKVSLYISLGDSRTAFRSDDCIASNYRLRTKHATEIMGPIAGSDQLRGY